MTKREPGVVSEILLLKWWADMAESGELLEVFGECVATPHGFLSVFIDPRTTLYYHADDAGIALAVWYEPFMGNTAIGLWARPDWRHRKWWDLVKETLVEQLATFPMILFMTKNANVITASRDMGFVTVGDVPFLYRGDTGTVGYLTRDTFKEKHGESSR